VTLQLWELGELGRAWVRDSLTSGKVLSRHVLARTNFEEGSTVALGVADRPQLRDVSDLAHSLGESYGASIEASAQALQTLLTEMRADGKMRLLVVEDDLARPDDPAIISRPPGSLLIADEAVYHLQDLADLKTADDLHEFLGTSASGFPLNGFLLRSLTRGELRLAFHQRRFRTVVAHVEAIINTIFDNDAFSSWLPDRILEPLLCPFAR